MPEQGGAGCLPLSQNRSCNDSPCPTDCKVGTWSSWSRCSAECGGGVTQRARDIKTHMRNGGKPCGQTSETKACNPKACEKAVRKGKPTLQCQSKLEVILVLDGSSDMG